LVSKTHLGAQTKDVIYSGVVGAKSGAGDVRISALRHYGLLTGDSSGSAASDLAKKINSAPSDELPKLYREAALHPLIFKELFNTFQGDSVTTPKLKQRASDLNVHPEETDKCIELYVSGMSTAGLVSVQGDKITHISGVEALAGSSTNTEQTDEHEQGIDAIGGNSEQDLTGQDDKSKIPTGSFRGPRAVFNVSVSLDSSLDIDKLAKQLEVLKRYGAI
jgi:hypothetical protein